MNPTRVMALFVATKVLAASHAFSQELNPASLFMDCKPKDLKLAVYPEDLRAQDLEGAVLLEVERKTDGSLIVLKIEASTPEGVFDEAATKYVANLTCSTLAAPYVGKLGVTFSLLPGTARLNLKGLEGVTAFQLAAMRVRRPPTSLAVPPNSAYMDSSRK